MYAILMYDGQPDEIRTGMTVEDLEWGLDNLPEMIGYATVMPDGTPVATMTEYGI